MSEELKILLVTAALGAVFFPILMWILRKTDFGKKETRKEVEERNFGRNK